MSARRFPFAADPELELRRDHGAQRTLQAQRDAAARDPRQLDLFSAQRGHPVRVKSAHLRNERGRGHR